MGESLLALIIHQKLKVRQVRNRSDMQGWLIARVPSSRSVSAGFTRGERNWLVVFYLETVVVHEQPVLSISQVPHLVLGLFQLYFKLGLDFARAFLILLQIQTRIFSTRKQLCSASFFILSGQVLTTFKSNKACNRFWFITSFFILSGQVSVTFNRFWFTT